MLHATTLFVCVEELLLDHALFIFFPTEEKKKKKGAFKIQSTSFLWAIRVDKRKEDVSRVPDRVPSRGFMGARGGMRPVPSRRIWLSSGAICWCRCRQAPPGMPPCAGRAAGTALLGPRPAKGKDRKRQPQPKLRSRKALLPLVSSSRRFLKTIR